MAALGAVAAATVKWLLSVRETDFRLEDGRVVYRGELPHHGEDLCLDQLFYLVSAAIVARRRG
jgi:hypothetical protein